MRFRFQRAGTVRAANKLKRSTPSATCWPAKVDLSSSAKAFQKAVQRDPSLASGDNNLGIVFARMKRFDEAERAFQRAIEKVPDFAEAYYNLGCLYLETGHPDRAIVVLRRALVAKPDYAKARAKLEQALARVSGGR